jgi:hypothetical protein
VVGIGVQSRIVIEEYAMKNLIILVLAIALMGMTLLAQVELVAAHIVTPAQEAYELELSNSRYCEQVLDGVYVRDDVIGEFYCRLDSGYISLGESNE